MLLVAQLNTNLSNKKLVIDKLGTFDTDGGTFTIPDLSGYDLLIYGVYMDGDTKYMSSIIPSSFFRTGKSIGAGLSNQTQASQGFFDYITYITDTQVKHICSGTLTSRGILWGIKL